MSENIDKNLYLAMLSEQCLRYNDMKFYLENLMTSSSVDFSRDFRTLLSICYKNLISKDREALHCLSSYYKIEQQKDEKTPYLSFIQEYQQKILQELENLVKEISSTINSKLVTKATNDEAKCFCYKLLGDYNRYVAENEEESEKKNEYKENAKKAYESAIEFGKNLVYDNGVKIGAILNYSVFLYEIEGDKKMGVKIAQEGYDKCREIIGDKEKDGEGDDVKEIRNIMELIEENLNMWNID